MASGQRIWTRTEWYSPFYSVSGFSNRLKMIWLLIFVLKITWLLIFLLLLLSHAVASKFSNTNTGTRTRSACTVCISSLCCMCTGCVAQHSATSTISQFFTSRADNFHDQNSNHKNHKNIVPWKFRAVWYFWVSKHVNTSTSVHPLSVGF